MQQKAPVAATLAAAVLVVAGVAAMGRLRPPPVPILPLSVPPAPATPLVPLATAAEAERPEPSGKLEEGVRVVTVRARRFEYVPKRIVVLQGEKVRLLITSEDVAHGFAIDEYGINRKLKPHETETVEFAADRSGAFRFYCTVYCGPGHMNMHGELVVLPPAK